MKCEKVSDISKIAKKIVIGVICFYRKYISPIIPDSCIYSPTCSQYAEIAVRRFGVLRGTWLSLMRIMRCNPFRNGGYDPVPDKWENRK